MSNGPLPSPTAFLGGGGLSIPPRFNRARPDFVSGPILAGVLESGIRHGETGNRGPLAERLSSGRATNLAEALSQLNPADRSALQRRWGRSLAEIEALSHEADPQTFYSGLLQIGQRLEDNEQLEEAGLVYSALVAGSGFDQATGRHSDGAITGLALSPRRLVPPSISTRAQTRLNAMTGVGAAGERFTFLARRVSTEATRPDMLIAMGAAGGIFRLTRLAATARWAGTIESGLGLRAAANATAFFAETAAFTGVGKLAGQAFGISQDWSPEAVLREWGSGAAMLLGLKVVGAGIGHLSGRWASSETAFGRFTQAAAPQLGMFGGILVGNRLAEIAGFHPRREGDTWFVDGLATLLQFNVAGRLQAAALGPGFARFERHVDLQTERLMRGSPFFAAEAVTPEGIRFPVPDDPLREARAQSSLMIGDSGENSDKTPRPELGLNPNGTRMRLEDRRELRMAVENIIQQTFPDYFENIHHLPSEIQPSNFRDQENIERRVTEFVSEADLEHFHPQDPLVTAYISRPWQNPGGFERVFSPAVGKAYREIQEAQTLLGQVEFADGMRYRPSALRPSENLSRALGRELYLFDDTTRPTGSFKERGAIVEVLRARRQGALHVVTASHGNHGLAVAFAAQKLGMRSTIVVPHTTPQVKIEALQSLGATVVTTHSQPWRAYEESRDWGLRYVFERNSMLEHSLGIQNSLRYIHGFEDVIPGQGVAGLEILEQIRRLPEATARRFETATFLIPMGGGGLAAGVATVIKQNFPRARVIGVVSDQAPALHVSLINGKRAEVFVNETSLCDSGIGLSVPGGRPFALLQEVLDGSLTVSDPQVGEAMRLIHRHEGLVVEGGAAAAVGALLNPIFSKMSIAQDSPVVSLLTGRNIDALRHAGVMAGREAFLPGGILDVEMLQPLIAAFRNQDGPERIETLLRDLRLDPEWVRRAAGFSEEGMRRNHVVVEPDIEIDLMAFKDGHVAPAHDHGHSRGWNLILEGEMIEAQFRLDEAGQLVPSGVFHYRPGDVSEMSRELIHEVYNRQGGGKPLIALQIFLPQIDFERMRTFPRQAP